MIKLMCLADLHLRETKPECRLDSEDWLSICADKFQFLKRIAAEKEVDAIVIAGDLFDTWRISFEFYNLCCGWLKSLDKEIIAIAGNHDIVYKNYFYLPQTPYYALNISGIIKDAADTDSYGAYLYTDTGYKDLSQKIVLAHKGLYLDEKPFPSAPETGNVTAFVHNCIPKTCQLLIAGDYHKPFVTKVGQCMVVNCGSLFRLRADQIDYKPTVAIATLDASGECSVELIPIPLQNNVRRDYIDREEKETQVLEEFVGSIDGAMEVTDNFKSNFYKLSSGKENELELNKLFERTLLK